MGYLDKILGRKPQKHDTVDESSFSTTDQPSQSTPEIVLDSATSSSYGPPSIESIGASAMMHSFPAVASAGTSSPRLYDPYEGISQSVVGKQVRKQVFNLPKQTEFLFEEEAAVRRRGWSENLQVLGKELWITPPMVIF